jgi:NAD(P)-dependent dehydrogenase (short-subunit alcohol dehydrogenase family)
MSGTKHWVVTGASRGIGLELVTQLLRTAEQVTALARNVNKAEGLQDLLRTNPARLTLIEADVTKDLDLDRAIKAIAPRTVDYLINNAGIYGGTAQTTLVELEPKLVQDVMTVNAISPLRVTKAFLPLLQKAKQPVVANISSLMGSIEDTSGGAYAYRMSKAALNMFTKCLANELSQGIAICLHPGWVKTEMGGAGAMVEKADSVAGLLNVIKNANHDSSGSFFDFRGKQLPW